MTAVFLSYSRADLSLATRIAKDLQRHDVHVWFDEWEIKVGDSITQKIERGLEEADFVAVLLTRHSVMSGWVDKEWQSKIGEEAQHRRVHVLPLKGEECEIPLLLKDRRYADLIESYDAGINDLIDAIRVHSSADLANKGPVGESKIARLTNLGIGGLSMPCFFPSISGAAKNSFTPLEHLQIITHLGHPLFLISAYDINKSKRPEREAIQTLLEESVGNGKVILLDSGVYEKRWLGGEWTAEDFRSVLRYTKCHISLSFDDPDPNTNIDEIVLNVVNGINLDRDRGQLDAVCPIVHARSAVDFPAICDRLAQSINAPLIAIPERELGDGVLEIAKNLRDIRITLNMTGIYHPIHILGCGNPLSILIYAACGADSFDGLDWCQTVADHSTGRLYHSLHLEFFDHQSLYGAADKLPYSLRVLAHNLDFYSVWMARIQNQIGEGRIDNMLQEFLPPQIASRITGFVSD